MLVGFQHLPALFTQLLIGYRVTASSGYLVSTGDGSTNYTALNVLQRT